VEGASDGIGSDGGGSDTIGSAVGSSTLTGFDVGIVEYTGDVCTGVFRCSEFGLVKIVGDI
jgi:hypothetical protein